MSNTDPSVSSNLEGKTAMSTRPDVRARQSNKFLEKLVTFVVLPIAVVIGIWIFQQRAYEMGFSEGRKQTMQHFKLLEASGD